MEKVIYYKEKTCEKCGQPFKPTNPKHSWCTDCLTKKCLFCGEPFFIGKKSKINSAKFCSRACKGKYNSQYRTGENAFHYKSGNSCKTVTMQCFYCHKDFQLLQGLAKKEINHFCCAECYADYLRETVPKGENHPNYCKIEAACEWCGKTFLTIPSTINKVRFCGKQCRNNWQSDMMKGENHHNWKGGIANWRASIMSSREYKEWRHEVFKRDNYTCQKCGDKRGGNLRAHHIKEAAKFPELILDIDNGITYCEDCHKIIHYGKTA